MKNQNTEPASDVIYTQGGSASIPLDPETHSVPAGVNVGGTKGNKPDKATFGLTDFTVPLWEEENARKARRKRNADSLPILFDGDRTDYRYVISQLRDSWRSTALKFFRGRYSASDWMKDQHGWLETASLFASAHPSFFNAQRALYCSRCGKLCFQPHFCFRCNLDQRVEPLQKMFEATHAKRPCWYSLVLDYEMDPRKAGIWTGLGEDRRLIHLPHQGKCPGKFFHCCPHQLHFVERFCDQLFHIVKCLHKSGVIDGWMAVLEPNLSFWPESHSPVHWWSGIDHAFLPHVHVLTCGGHPLEGKLLIAIYDALQAFLGTWSYANFWFNPVNNQTGIKKMDGLLH
jgi:hypothetical protein